MKTGATLITTSERTTTKGMNQCHKSSPRAHWPAADGRRSFGSASGLPRHPNRWHGARRGHANRLAKMGSPSRKFIFNVTHGVGTVVHPPIHHTNTPYGGQF